MRIIAGQRRGKRLITPKNRTIRPTADRIRESIFNIIADRVRDARVLDLFAGTGALGIEALSRGAREVFFVDSGAEAVALVQRNLIACGFANQGRVIQRDALGALAGMRGGSPLDLVFMDPPYNRAMVAPTLTALIATALTAPDALVVVEHAPEEDIPAQANGWRCIDRRRYGKTLVSFVAVVL
ncbi:MAG: 16S rRNA (guanine(966)-N(2))-methyltransferase RsmD [Desulfobacterales bacterium]|nr:16S rRNA (guanine(966)-N(2))-methyltransferase RsmD [Desulfobacteraceae bacterium]MDY0311472.1 16S rRNA (guanine(966)-N(2))-methyltransferase RsmD [Desulfobacterales bacterium]